MRSPRSSAAALPAISSPRRVPVSPWSRHIRASAMISSASPAAKRAPCRQSSESGSGFLALPLRDLVRGRQKLGRHLPGGGPGGQRADARRKVVRGHLSSPALLRPPLRQQRRGAPVEPERAAGLPERFAELRPRPRDAVQMHDVTILVRPQPRALGPRRYRLCPPCGMARTVRHRLAARARASARSRSRLPASSSIEDIQLVTRARSPAKGRCSSRTEASSPGSGMSALASACMRAGRDPCAR